MTIADQGRHETGAGRPDHFAGRFGENLLEPGPPFAQFVEKLGMGQQPLENGFLGRRQPLVTGQDRPRLDEYFQNIDTTRAIGGARPAEQTFIQALADPFRVFEHLLHQPVQQGQFSPGHVRFAAGLGKQRTDRLAHAAFHADHQLVLQRFHHPGQFLHTCHDCPPMILPGLRMLWGSMADLIRRE